MNHREILIFTIICICVGAVIWMGKNVGRELFFTGSSSMYTSSQPGMWFFEGCNSEGGRRFLPAGVYEREHIAALGMSDQNSMTLSGGCRAKVWQSSYYDNPIEEPRIVAGEWTCMDNRTDPQLDWRGKIARIDVDCSLPHGTYNNMDSTMKGVYIHKECATRGANVTFFPPGVYTIDKLTAPGGLDEKMLTKSPDPASTLTAQQMRDEENNARLIEQRQNTLDQTKRGLNQRRQELNNFKQIAEDGVLRNQEQLQYILANPNNFKAQRNLEQVRNSLEASQFNLNESNRALSELSKIEKQLDREQNIIHKDRNSNQTALRNLRDRVKDMFAIQPTAGCIMKVWPTELDTEPVVISGDTGCTSQPMYKAEVICQK